MVWYDMIALNDPISLSHFDGSDPLVRLSIACPALPLCGLALTEAERRMPGELRNISTINLSSQVW